jgi:hypothetical protein
MSCQGSNARDNQLPSQCYPFRCFCDSEWFSLFFFVLYITTSWCAEGRYYLGFILAIDSSHLSETSVKYQIKMVGFTMGALTQPDNLTLPLTSGTN